jgi:hypothetical protein
MAQINGHRMRLAEEFDKLYFIDHLILQKDFCVGCLLLEKIDMRLVIEEKKNGYEETLIVDEQFGCKKTKKRPRSVDSKPDEDASLVFLYGAGRINKKMDRPNKPFTQA